MSRFTISSDTGVFYLPLEFTLEHGGQLTAGQLAFDLQGPDDPAAPLVLVLGGISAGRDVHGWWPELVGPGLAVDTERYRVLGVDFLGGDGASTGPGNWQGEGEFPLLSSADQARALALLLDHLGVPTLHRFVGSSYGGMVGLAFAALYPTRLSGLLALGAAHESHPMALAWRSLQRQIVALGVAAGDPARGVALARGLAMTTYRSHLEFGQRFDAAPAIGAGRVRFGVEDYLDARGAAFAARFGPEAFLALSLAIDLHRIDPARIEAPTLLVGFTTDQLVPISQVRSLADALGAKGRLVELPSRFGHDGFLKEALALTPVLREAIDGEVL